MQQTNTSPSSTNDRHLFIGDLALDETEVPAHATKVTATMCFDSKTFAFDLYQQHITLWSSMFMVMFFRFRERDQPIRESRHGRATQQSAYGRHWPRVEQKLTVFENLPDISRQYLLSKCFA